MSSLTFEKSRSSRYNSWGGSPSPGDVCLSSGNDQIRIENLQNLLIKMFMNNKSARTSNKNENVLTCDTKAVDVKVERCDDEVQQSEIDLHTYYYNVIKEEMAVGHEVLQHVDKSNCSKETHSESRAETPEQSQNHNESIIKLETEAMSTVREEQIEELYADHDIKDEMVIGPVVVQSFPCMMEENGEPLPKKPRLETRNQNTEPDNTAKETRTQTNTDEITPQYCNENTEPSDTELIGIETHPASHAATSESSQNHNSNDRNRSIIKLETEAMSTVREKPTEDLYADHEIKDEMVIGPVVLQAVTCMMEENGEPLPKLQTLDTQDKTIEPDNTAKHTRTETNNDEMTSKDCNENTEPSDTELIEIGKNKIPTKTSKPRNNTQKKIRNDKNNKRTKNVFQCTVCAKQYDKKPDLAQHIESHDKPKCDIYFKCKECTYQSVTQCSLERHLKLHDKSRRSVCDVCGYRYTVNTQLRRHLRNVHSDEKKHECGICDYKTNNISYLKEHLRIHSGEKPYSCSQCAFKCMKKFHLMLHSRIHTGEKPYSCSDCNYKCADSSNLKQHLRTHKTHPASHAATSESSQNHNSNDRNRSIIKLETEAMSTVREKPTEDLYADHEIKDEMVIGPVVLQAVTCMMEENGEPLPKLQTLDTQDKTIEPDNTAKHTRTETNNDEMTSKDCNENTEPSDTELIEIGKNKIPTKTSKPRNNTQKKIRNDKNNKRTKNVFQCTVCAKQYDKKPDLAQHIESHDKTKRDIYFKCKECTYQSVTQCSLERHLKLHDKSRRSVCDVCGYRYPDSAQLHRHLRNVHSDEKILGCGICDYQTNAIGNLNIHIRIHSGEKPYSCSQCDFKCNRKCGLITHTRIHTGDKPYSCSQCEYKCYQKSDLITHSRIHTGEKPFSCSECNYKCARSSSLKRHLRTHIK